MQAQSAIMVRVAKVGAAKQAPQDAAETDAELTARAVGLVIEVDPFKRRQSAKAFV